MPTVQEIKDRLSQFGQKFKSNAKKAELQEQLERVETEQRIQVDTGVLPESSKTYGISPANPRDDDFVNKDTNAQEWSTQRQRELEEKLSIDGFQARVLISTRTYVKVKWFYNNKPFHQYKSYKFSVEEAKRSLAHARKSRVGV